MKWQYKTAKVALNTPLASIETALNNNGKNGWEVISVIIVGTDFVIFAKRLVLL